LAIPGKMKKTKIDVVLTSNIDMISDQFFQLRDNANPAPGIDFNFDNVTYVLNVLDVLAGDERGFVSIRNRRPRHRTLSSIDKLTAKAKKEAIKTREALQEEFDEAQKEQQKSLDESMQKLREKMQKKKLSDAQIMRDVATSLRAGQDRMQKTIEVLSEKHEAEVQKTETALAESIRQTQFSYKMWAVILPPILPLLLAAVIFFIRRTKESEGVSRSRMR
jgi:ABC-2 type transport system permease protein